MDDQTMALLATLFGGGGGLPKSKSLNTAQDFLAWMLSPELGAMTGSYDPYLTMSQNASVTPEVGMPITLSYAGREGTMGQIADHMLNGDWDMTAALQFAKQQSGTEGSDIFGLDVADEIKNIRDEINSYNKSVAESSAYSQDNAYSQAGLPTPDRQWTTADMPLDETLSSWGSSIASKKSKLDSEAKKFEGPAPTVLMQSAGRRGSPSAAAAKSNVMLGDVPRNADEARRMAANMGIDGDTAASWFESAANMARDSMSYQMFGKSSMDLSGDESNKLDKAFSSGAGRTALGSSWKSVLENRASKMGNPIFDALSSGSRGAAEKFLRTDKGAGNEPQTMKFVDPKWIKAKNDLAIEQKRLEQGQHRYDVKANARARTLQQMGRTPFKDALGSRLEFGAMLRQLGLM